MMQSALSYPTISYTFNEKPRNQQAAFIRGFFCCCSKPAASKIVIRENVSHICQHT